MFKYWKCKGIKCTLDCLESGAQSPGVGQRGLSCRDAGEVVGVGLRQALPPNDSMALHALAGDPPGARHGPCCGGTAPEETAGMQRMVPSGDPTDSGLWRGPCTQSL